MTYKSIDGVNYVRKEMETAAGKVMVEGVTVRALRKILESLDDDALVVYMAEGAPIGAKQDLIIGVIAGGVTTLDPGMCVLVGPEAVPVLKRYGIVDGGGRSEIG